LIIEDSTVGDVQLMKSTGHKRLDDAGMLVIRRWKFDPATQDGKHIKVWIHANLFWALRN
jgi:TonB family protein